MVCSLTMQDMDYLCETTLRALACERVCVLACAIAGHYPMILGSFLVRGCVESRRHGGITVCVWCALCVNMCALVYVCLQAGVFLYVSPWQAGRFSRF